MSNLDSFPRSAQKNLAFVTRAMERFSEVNWRDVLFFWDQGNLFSPDFDKDYIECWANVCAHCCTVAIAADTLISFLRAKGITLNRQHIIHAALLHDWNKRLEHGIMLKSRDVNCVSEFNADCAREIEKKFGDEVARLTLSTGDMGAALFLSREISNEGLIMYYADMSVSGHTVVGPWARIKSLQESFLPGRKYSHTNAHYEKTFGKSWEAVTVAIIQYFEKEILNLDQTNAITPLTKVFPKWRSYHDYAAQIEKKRNRR